MKRPDDTLQPRSTDGLARCPRFGLRDGIVAASLLVLGACGPSAAEEQARVQAVQEAEAQREERLRLAAAEEAERFRAAELAAAEAAAAEAAAAEAAAAEAAARAAAAEATAQAATEAAAAEEAQRRRRRPRPYQNVEFPHEL